MKRFLSIQGIDPNNYFDENLIKEDMFESFLNNFGKDIEKHKWQLEKITKYIENEAEDELMNFQYFLKFGINHEGFHECLQQLLHHHQFQWYFLHS